MAEDVLRHPERPALDAHQRRLGADAEERELLLGEREELVVVLERHVADLRYRPA